MANWVNRPGGGVAVYVREISQFKGRPKLERIGLYEISVKSKPVLVEGFYPHIEQ